MRLILHLILFLITIESYCQDKPIQILTYRHGCHGNCNFAYDDTCGLDTDSIIEVIKITKIKDSYFRNGELVVNQKINGLDSLLTNNLKIIKKLNDDNWTFSHAKFVPPSPRCFEFEEFKIYKNGKVYSYKLLNNDSSELGYLLRDNEIEFFKMINGLIK
jgi:hypothetical protein